MIDRVKLFNFLSYADADIDLSGSTVAVIGDNGVGKSSLLEAIPYAYYGIGREKLEGMCRIHGDGTHKVIVVEDSGVEIHRGRKKSGSGFFEIRKNDKLIAKGNDADEWVKSHVGLNRDTFLLTVFFGLHDVHHDTLIKVTPANRLEAFQKLAEVGPYKAFLKLAKAKYLKYETDIEKLQAKKEGIEATMSDEKELKKSIKDLNTRLDAEGKKYRASKLKKDELLVEEEKYQVFLKEKAGLEVERKQVDKDLRDIHDDISDANRKAQIKSDRLEIVQQKKAKLKLVPLNVKEYTEAINNLRMRIGEITGKINLLNAASEHGATTEAHNCPLCSSAVGANQIAVWKDQLKVLETSLKGATASVTAKTTQLNKYKEDKNTLDNLNSEIAELTPAIVEAEKQSQDLSRNLRVLQSKKKKKDDRFIDLQEKLGDDYQNLHTQIANVNEVIDTLTQSMASTKKEIDIYHKDLKKLVDAKESIAECDASIKKLKGDLKATKLLTTAWNRYGIPLNLIKRVMQNVEKRATAVYQEFDNGRISVTEVQDRGKPGIEFMLLDRNGGRTFNQLSAGEKILFFLSIRIAITQIENERKVISANYLILDEAMGNLSPKRRDDLVKLINKVLKKLFPQVIMVSHTEMRDVFTKILRVTKTNDTSRVVKL